MFVFKIFKKSIFTVESEPLFIEFNHLIFDFQKIRPTFQTRNMVVWRHDLSLPAVQNIS